MQVSIYNAPLEVKVVLNKKDNETILTQHKDKNNQDMD